jgi:hypothetical protein
LALGGDELPAIEPNARHPLQRLHNGHRFREPVFLTSPGYVEHGQADGPVAPDDAGGCSHLPAGADGDATAEAPRLMKRRKIRNCGKKATVIPKSK